jgi:hypothetical protein
MTGHSTNRHSFKKWGLEERLNIIFNPPLFFTFFLNYCLLKKQVLIKGPVYPRPQKRAL